MMDRAQTAIADQYAVALERRKNGGGEKSYTGYLYNQGLDKILKKCGEETFEVCIAAKNDDQAETVGELNDVLYHVTVLLCFSGVTLERVMANLNRRCQTEGQSFDTLMRVIEARRDSDDAESYTAYLFRGRFGQNPEKGRRGLRTSADCRKRSERRKDCRGDRRSALPPDGHDDL